MKLNWYFDFISPFAYLQFNQFDKLPRNVEIEYKPILLAGLLNHWKNIGPAEVPPKRLFTYQHCLWKAKNLGIDYKMPPAHPFNSLSALRLSIALNNDPKVIGIIFECIWRYGLDIHSNQAINHLQEKLCINNLIELVSQTDVKKQLITNTEQAAENNIFGVPTFTDTANPNQHFWGLDAFEMLLDYINNPAAFNSEEMIRLQTLPEGVQRKHK